MPKIWIGTGIEGFDNLIKDRFSDEYEPFIVPYGMGFDLINGQHGDVAIISEMLGTENALQLEANEVYLRIINHLRKQGIRVCFLGSEANKSEAFIRELVARGVYDILFSDDASYEEVFDLIEYPADYSKVSHWLDGFTSIEKQHKRKIQITLSHRPEEHETDEPEEIEENTQTKSKSRFSWSLKRNSKSRVTDSQENAKVAKLITVSGLPGVGSSFVALNLAIALSSKKTIAYVEASERPVLSPWMGWSSGEDSLIKLANNEHVERRRMITERLRAYNADPDLNTLTIDYDRLIQAARGLDFEYIVMDLPIHIFEKVTSYKKILVSNGDLAKCRRVSKNPCSLVVLNMLPKRMPIGIEEYQEFWPQTPVVMCPFLEEQSLSIVLGQPIALRQKNELNRFEGWLNTMGVEI